VFYIISIIIIVFKNYFNFYLNKDKIIKKSNLIITIIVNII